MAAKKGKGDYGPALRTSTPPGVARFPYIDRFSTNFNPDGEYSCDLAFDPSDVAWQAFEAKLAQHVQDEVIPVLGDHPVHLPFADEKDKDGQLTGRKLFRAKLRAKRTMNERKIDQRPKVYDAHLTPIAAPRVGGGSKLVLSVSIQSTVVQGTIYASARMEGVQILNLVEYGEHTPGAYGMQTYEDGYTAPDLVDEPTAAADSSGDY